MSHEDDIIWSRQNSKEFWVEIRELIRELAHQGKVFLWHKTDIQQKTSITLYDITRYAERKSVSQLEEWCMNIFLSDPMNFRNVRWFGINDRIYLETVKKL